MQSAAQQRERVKAIYGLREKNTYANQGASHVPLRHMSYDVRITAGTACTRITQVYENGTSREIETEFWIPIMPHTVFTEFSAELRGKTVRGVVREKEEARREYAERTAQGAVAALSQISSESPDVMKIDVGNIPPGESLTVRLAYAEEVQVSGNKFWMYKLPMTITPRYFNAPLPADSNEIINAPTVTQSGAHASYTADLTIKIDGEPECVHSPTHEIDISPFNAQEKAVTVRAPQLVKHFTSSTGVTDTRAFAKDFTLLYRTKDISKPACYLAASPQQSGGTSAQSYAAMVTFVPDLSSLTVDDALRAQVTSVETDGESTTDVTPADFNVSLNTAKGEFVFVLDRSGSMGGIRIQKAKDALILFLKSLPSGSSFNIYSFGSSFNYMFPQSTPYTDDNVEFALKALASFDADMGGTEIEQPLRHIFDARVSRLQQSHALLPMHVFLLTDGDVSSPNEVVRLIARNRRAARVHTIGVGDGASRYLITQGAEAGRGKHLFVDDNADVQGRIVALLKSALTPYLDSFVVSHDAGDAVDAIVPAPDTIPFIAKNEPFNMFLFFKEGVSAEQIAQTRVTLRCFDSKVNATLEWVVPVQASADARNAHVYQLGVARVIRGLEARLRNTQGGAPQESVKGNSSSGGDDDVALARTVDAKREIVALSTKHSVLSTYTAFLCIVEELPDEQKHQERERAQKVIVPQLISADQAMQFQQQMNSLYHSAQCSVTTTSAYAGFAQIPSPMMAPPPAAQCYAPPPLPPAPAQYYAQPVAQSSMSKAMPQSSIWSAAIKNPYLTNIPVAAAMPSIAAMSATYASSSIQQDDLMSFDDACENVPRAAQAASKQIKQKKAKAERRSLNSEQQCEDLFAEMEAQPDMIVQESKASADLLDFGDFAFSPSAAQAPPQLQQQQQIIPVPQSYSPPNFTTNSVAPSFAYNQFIPQAQPVQQQAPPAHAQQPIGFMDVVKHQRLNGSWTHSEALLAQLGSDAQAFVAKAQQYFASKNFTLAVWTTLCVLLWLRKHHAAHRDRWQLIEQKALEWLTQNGVQDVNEFAGAF